LFVGAARFIAIRFRRRENQLVKHTPACDRQARYRGSPQYSISAFATSLSKDH
jgi:hypothetical protein